MMTSAIPFTAIAADEETELWNKFLKYDLCITDYDSLTEKEQELCHFIYDTETRAEDTIVCNRARAILAGYDVGNRITVEQAEKYKHIVNPEDFLFYNGSINDYYEYEFPSLLTVPDISHIDEPDICNEYWLDDTKSSAIIYNSNGLYIQKYNNEGEIEYSELIDTAIKEKSDIEKNGLVFTVLPDDSLSLTEYKGADKEVKIPSEIDGHFVKSIDIGAFSETDIASVDLPETIETIYPYAFLNCSELTAVNFPSGLKYIGYKAFGNCTSLKDVIIDCPYLRTCGNVFDSAKAETVFLNIKEPSSWLYGGFAEVKNFSFGDNTEILTMDYMIDFSNLGIPESVSVIKALYNMNFDEVNELTIPKNIKIFGAYPEPKGVIVAEWGKIPASVPLKDNFTIKGYKGTEAEIYAKELNIPFIALDDLETPLSGNYSENIKWTLDADGVLTLSGEGEIPDLTESAPWSSRRADIQTIIVEDGITSIGKDVFIGLEDLTSVSLPKGIKSISDEAFYKCINLKTINFPDGLERIGSDAFFGCQIESLILPESLTEIGERAFYNCRFTSAIIPDNVNSIGECAFSYCTELENITIPDTVSNIDGAFTHCKKLKEVKIPSSVEKIREDTFFACTQLETIIFMNPDTIICDENGDEIETFFTSFEEGVFKGVIRGYKASTAEKYAIKYNTSFETLISEKSGDSNGDGRIDMSDAVLIMQTIANPSKYKLTEQGSKNADMDGDGVTNADALAIQKKLLKLE